MNRLSTLLLLFPVLFSCVSNYHGNSPDFVSAGVIPDPANLRVVTINVWSGLDYKGIFEIGEYEDEDIRSLRTRNLLTRLKDLDADVISVNEANMLPRYAQSLAGELNYDQIYDIGLGGMRIGSLGFPVNLSEGDVILAKTSRQLKSIGREQLSGGPSGKSFCFHFDDATQIVGGKITVGNQDVFVFTTHWHASPCPTEEYLKLLSEHLDSNRIDKNQYKELKNMAIEGEQVRIREAEKTIAFINKATKDHPVILMGDFNAAENSVEIGLLKAAGFRDAYAEAGELPGFTWDGKKNTNIQLQKNKHPEDFLHEPTQRRIDYIFYRGPALQLISSKVVLDKPVQGLYSSDHFGVMAEFKVIDE